MMSVFTRLLPLTVLVGTLGVEAQDDLSAVLEPIRAEFEAPALGAIVWHAGKTKVYGAVGLRKFEGSKEVTIDDKWHIGSCTKSMTATLVATFVEDGTFSWEATIGEVLGNKIQMHEGYRDKTFVDLLAHVSGITGDIPPMIWTQAWMSEGKRNVENHRLKFVENILALEPKKNPKFEYSNAGYVVAGVMLEVKTGRSWEELMNQRLFKPLEMNSAGFGAPAKRREEQPWGHESIRQPKYPGIGDDNPLVIGPAGTVHASLRDLARYASMHALRETGPVLKKKVSYDKLHEVVVKDERYALGWGVSEARWTKGDVLGHSGSNTLHFCLFTIAPKERLAIVAVSNVGGKAGEGACGKTTDILIKKYAK